MSTESIFERIAEQRGWNLQSQVDVLLRYIDNQQSNTAFRDFLLEQAEDESTTDADAETTTNFVNAQAKHREHPDTFEVPTAADLGAVRPGDYVKICDKDERFWVKVTVVEGSQFTGTVNNVLVFPHDFKDGDVLTFTQDCVYNIMTQKELAAKK